MKLVALTLARDSAWCIGATVGHALTYCDAAVVLCHACTDGTGDIVKSLGNTEVIKAGNAEGWSEMDHRQATLDKGREIGGTHFLILDDDEMACAPLVPLIRPVAETLEPGEIAMMPMICCWRDLGHFRSDNTHNPFRNLMKSTVFADHPSLTWKPREGYHHHHTHPFGSVQRLYSPGRLRWMHFQHASWPRLVAKQTWYMMMELVRYGRVRADYAGSMSERGLERKPVPDGWWGGRDAGIDLAAEPWQVADMRRMVRLQGLRFFTGRGINVERALAPWEP